MPIQLHSHMKQETSLLGWKAVLAAIALLGFSRLTQAADPVLVGQWPGYVRGYAQAVVVTNHTVYVAAGQGGLLIFDASDPTNLVHLGSCITTSGATGVAIAGNYAYVADSLSGLQVIDIGNPFSPTQVGRYDTAGYAYGVALAGNFAYVADNDAGLQVLDVSNPTAPKRVAGYDTTGYAHAVTVVGTYAYVADGADGLQIIDVSNPLSPARVGGYGISVNAFSVAVSGSYAYVAERDGGLQVIDVSNTINPVLVGRETNTVGAIGVQVVGHYAYVANYPAGLQCVDLSDPTNPLLLGGCTTRSGGVNVAVVDDFAYVVDGSGDLEVIDVSDRSQPKCVSRVGIGGNAASVAISAGYAYVADGDLGLQVLDVTNPAAPTWAGNETSGRAVGVAVSGSFAYVTFGSGGLKVMDINSPTHPLRVYDTLSIWAQGVATSGGYVYTVHQGSGLRVLDISNPAWPRQVGWLSTPGLPGSPVAVSVSGHYAYVAASGSGLQVIDISNPVNNPIGPVLVGGYDTSGWACGVAVAGTYAYVADGSAGLQVIDVSNPTNCVRMGGCSTSGEARGVAVLGDYAYMAVGQAGLEVIDVSNPSNPIAVGRHDTSGFATAVTISGNYAYVADGAAGVSIFRIAGDSITNGTNLFWTSIAPVGTARAKHAGAVVDGRIYVFGGEVAPDGPNGGVPTSSMERYDPQTSNWVSRTSYTLAAHEASAAAMNGKVYVFGAELDQNFSFVAEYDPASDSWQARAPKLTATYGSVAAPWNGEIYLFGGTRHPPTEVLYGGVEAYNPVSNTWRFVTTIPYSMSRYAVAVRDGMFYLFGGVDPSSYLARSNIIAFDAVHNQWITSGLGTLPKPLGSGFGSAVPVLDGKAYLVGGFTTISGAWQATSTSDVRTTADVLAYDFTNRTFATVSPLPQPSEMHVSLAVNGSIYVVGGRTLFGTHNTMTAVAWKGSFRAVAFDGASDALTNPWLGLYQVGDSYSLAGVGTFAGAIRSYSLISRETVLGVKCLVLRILGHGIGFDATRYYDVRIAQGTEGNLRVLKVTGTDYDGTAVNWMAASAVQAFVFVPAFLQSGQSWPWHDGQYCQVLGLDQTVPLLSTGLGPYTNCAVIRQTGGAGADVADSWWVAGLGVVKEVWNDGGQLNGWERLPGAATSGFAGSDDFNDNQKDEMKWGPDIDPGGSHGTVLHEVNQRLELTSNTILESGAFRPWVLNSGSYTQDWEVAVDVHMGPVNLAVNGSHAEVLLAVWNAGDKANGFGLDHLAISLDLYRDNQGQVSRTFTGYARVNGLDVLGGQVNQATSAVSARLRISYEAATTTLRCWYDVSGTGSAWQLLRSVNVAASESNWEMGPSSRFEVGIGGSCAGIVLTPADGLYLDNFNASTASQPPGPVFEADSDLITNPWVGLHKVGDSYSLAGVGSFAGVTRTWSIIGQETVLGVKCLVMRVLGHGTGFDATRYYDVRIAQDNLGSVRMLRLTGTDYDGTPVDWAAASVSQAVVFGPADLQAGLSWQWPDGQRYEVLALNQTVPLLTTGLGPYTNCALIRRTAHGGADVSDSWRVAGLGDVKDVWNDGGVFNGWERLPGPLRLGMELVAEPGNQRLVFNLETVLGRSYQLLSRTNLTQGEWQPDGNAMSGTGGAIRATNSLSADRQKFYRVRVVSGP
jgi:hypothetical protein